MGKMEKNEACRVYLLFTRSSTLLSRAIHFFTGDGFTHVSIAFDESLKTLCSFARRHEALPLPAGLVRESLQRGFYESHRYISCALYAVSVEAGALRGLRNRAERMLACGRRYRYNLWGLPLCRLGIAWKRPRRYFCSQFVAEMLSEEAGISMPKLPSLMRPQDLSQLGGMNCLYRGRLSGLMHDPQRQFGGQMLNFDDVKPNSLTSLRFWPIINKLSSDLACGG